MQGPLGPLFQSGADGRGYNFGLGGLINGTDVEGLCYRGTMTWYVLRPIFDLG